ncbi:hypothetical protein FRC06_000689 [Ceratobasidium sp. 370]|nr:hypothetical protein FRC06_000689 [Ceratobasidium sp. 370]
MPYTFTDVDPKPQQQGQHPNTPAPLTAISISPVLPPTTVLLLDYVSAISILLSTHYQTPAPDQCYTIAAYLECIYRQYQAFHNGGTIVHHPEETLLDSVPVVGREILCLRPNAHRRHTGYLIKPTMGRTFSGAIYTTRQKLINLADMLPEDQPRSASLFRPFHQYRMHYLEEPEHFSDLRAFNQIYDQQSMPEILISETQLWLAFTPMFCSLLASATGVNPHGVSQFTAAMFHQNRVVIWAHNWYMLLQGAPKEYFVYSP